MTGVATKLKVVDDPSDLPPPAPPPEFIPAPTRNRRVGWTAERQRAFIDMLSLTGSVGAAAAAAGVSSRSAYRLRNPAAITETVMMFSPLDLGSGSPPRV